MSVQLQSMMRSSVEAGHWQYGLDTVGTLLSRCRAVTPYGSLNGVVAYTLLEEWLRVAEAFAADHLATTWAPYRWLWYLRRTGDEIFRGAIPTSQRYARVLTEALCIQGHAQMEMPEVLATDTNGRKAIGYQVTQSVANTIAFGCGYGAATTRLHACLRSVAKDATLHISTEGVPTIIRDEAEERAVATYDARVVADQGVETYVGTFQDVSIGPTANRALALFMRAQRPFEMSVPPPLHGLFGGGPYEGHYVPGVVHLDNVASLMSHKDVADARLWDPELAHLVTLARLSMLLVVRREVFLLKSCVNGYDLMGRDDLAALFDEAREEVLGPLMATLPGLAPHLPNDGTAFVECLLGMRSSSWPLLAGPVAVQVDDAQIALNVGAASDRLVRRIELPNIQGAVANVRSAAFEQSVQDRIDETSWCPPASLKQYVRRQLRRDGVRIGECDAIAHKPGTTFLIACKARAYTLRYDAGVFSDVRNATTALRDDVEVWGTFVRKLDEVRVGDNYDLRKAGQLNAVVVTPHVLYVDPDTLGRMAETGLHTYSSAGELMGWLKAH